MIMLAVQNSSNDNNNHHHTAPRPLPLPPPIRNSVRSDPQKTPNPQEVTTYQRKKEQIDMISLFFGTQTHKNMLEV